MSDTFDKRLISGKIDLPLLGEGVEASVYALNDDQVLRLYKPGGDASLEHLRQLQLFYQSLDESQVPFTVPDVQEAGTESGTLYTIDRRVYGQNMNEALASAEGPLRQQILHSYIQAAGQIQKLHPPYDFYGEVLSANPIRVGSWPAYILRRLTTDYQTARKLLDEQVPKMPEILAFLRHEVDIVSDTNQSLLVHGDYYVLNVTIDTSGNINGVLDFNDLTLAGDPRMDLASSLIFLLEGDGNARLEDGATLLRQCTETYGDSFRRILHLYRLYYAIHFASYCKDNDSTTFAWCIRSLQEHTDGSYKY